MEKTMAIGSTKEKLHIFDTSLRDGEQSPGVTLHINEKVEIAKSLSRLGVDICEAGFPVASEGDFQAVQLIAREVGGLMSNREKIGKPMVICALARAVEHDIRQAYEAIKDAPFHRIHTFLATSDIHLQYKLKISRSECIERAVTAVKLARSLVPDVEFSPEDSGRSDKDFLCEVLSRVIEAGATTLNIPDTVGYNTPEEYGKMIKYLRENTRGGDKVIWSTHCHNDLGLATANTLAGVTNGARQVEVTINGIGERAGNTALEEIVMALYTHPNYFPVFCAIDTTQIHRTSQLVTQRTGMVIQPNKAIVGANAFAHESGIHQDGVLKHQQTYEIINPSVIGLNSNSLVLGKHSGRNAFRNKLLGLGYSDLPPTKFQQAFERFKRTADTKKVVTDHDILAIMDDELDVGKEEETFKLQSLNVVANLSGISTATIEVIDTSLPVTDLPSSSQDEDLASSTSLISSNIFVDAAISRNGPIHAIFKTIQRLVNVNVVLSNFEVKSVGAGVDALGQVTVRIREARNGDETPEGVLTQLKPDDAHRSASFGQNGADWNAPKDSGVKANDLTLGKVVVYYHGHASDTDIMMASAKAFLNAINRLISDKKSGNKRLRSGIEARKVDV